MLKLTRGFTSFTTSQCISSTEESLYGLHVFVFLEQICVGV